MSEKFSWEKSGHLPQPFTWLCRSTGNRPAIWACKRKPGNGSWYVQFSYRQHSMTATGRTRDEAASNLVRQFADAS